jgi:hypothetical protein
MAEHALQQRHVGSGVLAGTSMVEALAGLGAIVLAIVGLAGGVPTLAMNIATIVAGVALWFEGGSLAARYQRVQATQFAYEGGADVAGGMSAEMMAGLTGVVLGILALIGISPGILVPAALTTYGGGLLIGAGANARAAVPSASTFAAQPTYDTTTGTTTVRPEAYARELPQAFGAAAGGQLMVGIGATVLGILALVGVAPTTLSLVGLLAIGASILLTGTAAGAALFGARRGSHV